ncbi:MAG: AraC family transcriptional regulator ligand-binding domain-containing protein [Halioglobus sp.]
MPTKNLVSLLRVVVDQGYEVERALEHIELDFNPLLDSSKSPDRVPTSCYSKLYQLLMELQQDEAFGLGNEYHSPPGTFRMMCLFIIHCNTLQAALTRSAEFYDYCKLYRKEGRGKRYPAVIYLPDGDHALCLFERFPAPTSQSSKDSAVAYANVLLMMYRFYSWLIGKELPLREVWLRASAPVSSLNYEQLFNCPIVFDREQSGLVISTSLLEHPLAQNEETLEAYLRQTPYRLVKPGRPHGTKPLTRRVEQLLVNYSVQKTPSADFVAEKLNMSARTLHRKLTAEDTSFQILKDQYRKELAIHYIARPELTIDAIAALMGFQENSAFYRSFKKWTGMSPGSYRSQFRQGNARNA